MVDITAGESEMKRLHTQVDAEMAQARSSEDPEGVPDTELQAYEARMRNLHEAVIAVEEYEDTLGDL